MKLYSTNDRLKKRKRFQTNPINLVLLFLLFTVFANAQSSDQNLPTPISANLIDGEIKARDIGDSRLTTFYYVFNGNRGDIFINVVSSNLNGDLDIFLAEGLRPKTKITFYAETSESETGRVIYLRKPEKLIMRIQGRSPNDDAATFQIKFAGSFEPIQAIAGNLETNTSTVAASSDARVKVNSVGTIIEEIPKSTPKKVFVANSEAENVATNETEIDEKITGAKITLKNNEKAETQQNENTSGSNTKTDSEKPQIPTRFDPTKKVDDILKENRAESPKIVITDPFKPFGRKEDLKPEDDKVLDSEETDVTVELKDKTNNVSSIVRIEKVDDDDADTAEQIDETSNPLAKVFLKVELKNGDRFERSMVEVLSMNVIKGILTIVTNDGKIQEYSILEVVKMTIQ